eukprot:TRINITY_DN32504_c0_g1_i1.p1 TRINITY_DN32504_c0_g1~~TRINITY_DN32504_c0_g1_i1.p1  ORF type:complete len:1977 (+),score=460.55 TRINITY_DN32504_c0_g1_i1:60-5990(+)
MADQYDRVLIRLSSTEDDKLEPILGKLLPLVFEELLTQTEAAARNKIIGVLNHALTRCKGNTAIKIPVQGVVEKWFSPALKGSPNGPFFRNLSVIFIDLGLPRLQPKEQIDLALLILQRFGELAAPVDRPALFLASVPGLAHIPAEGFRKEQVTRCLDLIAAKPADEEGLVGFFHAATEFLMVPCGSTDAPSVSGLAATSWGNWKARLKSRDATAMVALKVQVLKWLGALAAGPPASLTYLPSLAAMTDNYDAVANAAMSNCARLDPELDLDTDEALLGKLICQALTSAPPGLEEVTGAMRVEPKANVPGKLRIKVLTLMQRANGIAKAAIVPYVVHVIRQSLREHEAVQLVALQLALTLAERAGATARIDGVEEFVVTTNAALKELEEVFWPGGGVVSGGQATSLAFRVYGAFARQLAELPGNHGRNFAIDGAPRMLALLAANEGTAQDILDALSGLIACLRDPAEDGYLQFVPLLDRLVASPRPVVRREVLRWASALFPTHAPEGRYYALRLFGDADPDISRSAETALAGGRHESPPFGDMCGFLAARALTGVKLSSSGHAFVGAEGEAAGLQRLAQQSATLVKPPAALPALGSGFTLSDVARALSFLLALAESEGVRFSTEGLDTVTPPLAKKPRLASEKTPESSPAAGLAEDQTTALLSFVALLDYLLAQTLENQSSVAVETMADGMTLLELALRGLLLATALAGGSRPEVLKQVVDRAELVLFTGGPLGGALFREGGLAVGRARRLGAVVLGVMCDRLAEAADSPVQRWLDRLASGFDAAAGSATRAGAVLAVCELLRTRPAADGDRALCSKALGLMAPGVESDTAVLSSACDALRRLSERRRLVWDVLETDVPITRQAFLDRLYGLSEQVMSGLGDTKEAEIGTASRDLVHASWRLLGQLAAWNTEGTADCISRLIEVGKKSVGEEAVAALGLAIAAACSDPTASASAGQGNLALSPHAERVMRQLLKMIEDTLDTEADSADKEKDSNGEMNTEPPKPKLTLAEKDAIERCGVVWLATLTRRLATCGKPVAWLGEDLQESLSRAFVRATGCLSMFTADCGIKALCYLYRLATTEQARTEMLKTTFTSFSNRTSVNNKFVGHADTQTRRDADKAKEAAGPNSLKITAKERIDSLKDLLFLARDLGHHPIFMALIDQPSGSIWTGEVFREAIDLQMPCLPDDMREHLCPTRLRPKLYPFFFHNNAPLRQAVVKMAASYFSCESPQQLCSKYPEEWPAIARSLVQALGSSRVTTRQAAIGAAQVLFRGREWHEVNFIFEDLWNIVLRLMDDLEESVIAMVRPLVRMLRNLTLRLCDLKLSKKADAGEAIKVIIPLLLQSLERWKHAGPFCFDVMREIVKSAHGTTLMTPYVQDLIPPLLTSLSMMENEKLQYWQFHIDANNAEKGKELEEARISHSRTSESMRLIRLLVPLITEENAEAMAPKTRDLLHRGVGANTRVGVCDFWVSVCAERPSSVPTGGSVASGMLRSVAGALLDPSLPVRAAAASCFASFARRNEAPELTKVVFERLISKDQDFRVDDAQRSSFRCALARALSEVCRRCDDSVIEPQLKAAIAAKAFGLRYSEEPEVKNAWEPIWNEICPTTASGVERHYKHICAELSTCFSDSISRAEKVTMAKAVSGLAAQLEKTLPRPNYAVDEALLGLHKAVLVAVQTLPVFDGNGPILRALADLSALLFRRKRNESLEGCSAPNEATTGLPLVLGFCAKGLLVDRGSAARAALELMAATRLWSSLSDAASLYGSAAARVDEMQKQVEAEKREPGEPVPVKHRGKTDSPAEVFLTACLDMWTSTLEQCRKEAEDEGDLDPPEGAELNAYFEACLTEFYGGSLAMRLGIIRMWKRVFNHLKEERFAACLLLSSEMQGRIAASIQSASLDQRSERLRRPALELGSVLVADTAAGGGRDFLKAGLVAAVARRDASSVGTLPAAEWLTQLDPTTAEQEATAVAALRAALVNT